MGDSESSLPNNAVASTRAVTRCEWQSLISGWEINTPVAKCAKKSVFGHSARVLWRPLFSG